MTISTQRLRFLRGNSAAVAAFTGLQGELVFNTTTYTLHLQDGSTAGGYSLATSAQLANITANANYGNSNVASYLASNSNLAFTTTANIITNANLLAENYIASNILVIGGSTTAAQHSLLISNVGGVMKFFTGNRTNGNTSIQLQANNSLGGIYIRNDNGSIGFNTVPSGPAIGYTFTFNGSIYSNEYYAEPNLPTGYQFATVDGDTGLSHVEYGGNLSAIRIKHAGDEVAKFYNNNTTEIKGNLVVTDGVSFGTFPDAYMQIYGNVNSYQQIVAQNLSNNAAASTDFVATSDNGNDTQYFINMGINSSQFNQASWFPAANTVNEGYLYVVGYNATGPSAGNSANLIIGSTNGVVKTFVGNTADANVVTTVSTNLLTVSGNVNANYFIGNGSLLTGITAGTNYSNTNVAAYLTVYNGAILTNTINFSDSTVQTTAWKAGGNSAFSSNSIFVNNVSAGNFNNNGDFNVVFDAYTGGPTLNFSANYQSPLNSNVGITVQAVNTPIIMSNGNIELRANLSTAWTFDTNGILTLPGEGVLRSIGDSVTLQSYNVGTGNVQSVYLGSGGGLGFFDQDIGGNWLEIFKSGAEPQIRVPVGRGNLNIQTAEGINAYDWVFGSNGDLTLPGSLSTPSNVTVNDTLFVVGSIQPTGASPAPYLSGFSSISTVISGNANEGNITAHNYLRANGGIITTGNITGGNLSVTGNISAQYFAGNGSLLTGVDAENSATIDILNTNGLGTVFYPTFVEDRTNGQILRADVDLSYRTDDNILTVQNISSSGNISASYFIGNITGNTAGFAIGYRDIPQVVFTSNATLALTDAGKHYYSANSANIITVPNNATVSFNIGAAISIVQQGTANLTVTPASGVTMYLAGNSTSASRTLGNYGMATLMKVGTDTWFINGTGLT